MANTEMSPRFCIAEQNGLQEPKYRVIDDLSRSEVNSTTDTTDTYCPQYLDTLVAHVRALAKLGVSDFRAWSVDFPNAYKAIGLHESSLEAATICLVDPGTNVPHKARILVQPFGSRRAPANWGRVVTFIQFPAKELQALTVGALLIALNRLAQLPAASGPLKRLLNYWASLRLIKRTNLPKNA